MALSEDRTQFLFIIPSLGSLRDAFFVAHSPAHQQSTYQEILFEVLAHLPIDLFRFSAAAVMNAAPSALVFTQIMSE